MSGVAGSARPRRIEGWSPAPLASRLPAVVLVAALGLAALARPAAPFVFVGILFLYLVTRRFDRRSLVLAAVLPAATILVWRSIPQPIADPAGADCANLLAPPAVWRFLEGATAFVVVLALALDRRASLIELGFRPGSRNIRMVALAGLLLLGPIALYASTVLGGSELGARFFGRYAIDVSQPLALLPAVVFAASNALAEELSYRGAMRTWLVPSLGVSGANLAQALVFGLAHTGDDFRGLDAAVPTFAAMVAVGYVAGIIARRTGSLTIPIAIHLAADIPIYYYWACRIA